MKRKRFTEEQIIGVLKESEAGAKTKELWLKHYKGHFLAEEGDKPWLLPMRDRLAATFRAEVRRAAMAREAEDNWEGAVLIYETALQADNAAEDFYYRAMSCLHKLGRTSEALNTYQRCRRILAAVLNAKPSRDTELLYQRLIRE